MKTSKILYTLALVLISIFLLSFAWEFAVEDSIMALLNEEFEPESRYERWEYVITATVFAALALVLPAWLLLRKARGLRRLQSELKTRVEQRTRELQRQLDKRQRIEQHLRKEIYERQLAESLSARMARIIENFLDEVYVLDAETLNFLQVNRRGRENLGFSLEQLQTRGYADLVPGWTRERFAEKIEPLRAGRRDELLFETRHRRKDGSQYDAECRVQYLPLEHPPVFVVMLQDITLRKQMQAEIVEARDKAEAASAAKSLFLASVSHELRTPLSAVIGMSDVLAHTSLSAEQQHYVDTIYSSSTAFIDIINGLLDLSMIESGKFKPRDRDFDLHAVVEGMLDMLAYRACQRGLELLSLVDEDVPACLRGDPLALRQILLNLLGNAIKFTDYGVVDLRVGVATGSAQHCRLRIAVRDTGMGISSERQAELFQPYTHGDGSARRRVGGVGLGLSVCKSLIDSLQGRIGVESVPGKGSVFWCELDFAIGTLTEEATASRQLLSGVRCLVVDDNALARSTLQTQLEAQGLRAETVGDATQALQTLRRADAEGDPCALALVDADMPGIDGLSLAYAIKADQALAGTAVLMLTAVDAPIKGETQQRVGFELQRAKPIRQSELPYILGTLIGGQEPAEQREEGEVSAFGGVEVRPLRVMVVDDQPVNQEMMQLMLQRLNCDVTLPGTAEEALDLLEERAHDVVLMDCLMPGMDGYTATAAIRRRESDDRHVVIIAMTALAVPGEREHCLAAGMDDYLCKPVSEEMLRNTLKQWFPQADLRADTSTDAATANSDTPATWRQQIQAAGPAAMARLVELFVDDTARSLAAMRQTLAQGDGHELAKMAHALKGSCLQLGVARMADCCDGLEAAARGDNQAAAELALAHLSTAFDEASSELETLSEEH